MSDRQIASQTQVDVDTGIDARESIRRPAIGVDATARETDIDTFVQAVQQTQQHDAHVLVGVDAAETRLLTHLRSLDITIIEISTPAQSDAKAHLRTAAKELGFPGVLMHPDPEAEIQYAESREAFLYADEYAIPARVTDPSRDVDVIAGIPAEAAHDSLEHLVRRASTHADQVLVAGTADHPAVSPVADHDAVSVVDGDGDNDVDTTSDSPSALAQLCDHVAHRYADFDALILLTGAAHPQSDPAAIPELVNPISAGDADVVVGNTATTDDTPQDTVSRRVWRNLVDAFTLGSADRPNTDVQSGLQALSADAVTHLTRDAAPHDASADLLEHAIRSDLDVRVTDIDTDSVNDTDTTTSGDTDLDRAAVTASATASETVSSPARHSGDDTDEPARHADEETLYDSSELGPTTETTTDSAAEGYIVGADADTTPLLSVVIPTMNEEEGIGTCLEWVKDAVADLKVPTEIIISDSSTDRTPAIAREHGAIVVEPDKPGYGYAYRYAFDHMRGEYVVMGDADTTYDFSEIPRLLNHLQETGADIVMGSRLDGEIKPGAMPALHKYIGNPLLTKFLNTFYDAGVSDAHSGFRVFTQDALAALDLDSTGMEFASEMIMDASVKGLDIEEIPITYHERVGEETLDSFRDGWRHVRFMLVNAPAKLFSMPAVAMMAIGVLMLALSWIGVSVNNVTFSVHTALAGSLLTIVGYQVGMLGVFSTIAADPIEKPTDRLNELIVDSVQLEHGLVIGGGILMLGSGYAATMVGRWLTTGTLPLVVPNLLAFTTIVIGMQTMFNAFCFSVLATTKNDASGDSRRAV